MGAEKVQDLDSILDESWSGVGFSLMEGVIWGGRRADERCHSGWKGKCSYTGVRKRLERNLSASQGE